MTISISSKTNSSIRFTGGDLKVMIEEGVRESPPRKYRYSPAPQGHFPEELMTQAPIGLASWDDIRVRYKYYKDRGYLRDLDLNVGFLVGRFS